MLVICDGNPKSGSTFLFEACKCLGQDYGIDTLANLLNCSEYLFYNPETGMYSGFTEFPMEIITLWLQESEKQSISNTFCVKTHFLNLPRINKHKFLDSIQNPLISWVVSARNPFDVAQSLVDQARKEMQKPLGLQREGFVSLLDPGEALVSALDALRNLLEHLGPPIHLFIYPDFINGSERALSRLREALKLSKSTSDFDILNAINHVDREIRSGNIWGEFNNGQAGRGFHVREIVDPKLAAQADSLWEKILRLSE